MLKYRTDKLKEDLEKYKERYKELEKTLKTSYQTVADFSHKIEKLEERVDKLITMNRDSSVSLGNYREQRGNSEGELRAYKSITLFLLNKVRIGPQNIHEILTGVEKNINEQMEKKNAEADRSEPSESK